MSEIKPVMETLSFVHKRSHNIYFKNVVPGMAPDHPAMQRSTLSIIPCAATNSQSVPIWIYECPQFAVFLAATLEKDALFTIAMRWRK